MGEAAPKNNSTSSQRRNDSNSIDNLGQDQDISKPPEDNEDLPHVQPQEHHHISPSVRHKIQLSTWLGENKDDPALKVRSYYQPIRQFLAMSQNFLPRLKEHLLGQLLGHEHDDNGQLFTAQEQIGLTFLHNRIYRHSTFCVNYTTYDLRRAQDTLNPRTHADFITLSHEDGEEPQNKFPYWFGRIVAIFHAAVIHVGPGSRSVEPQHMEFLFV